MLRDTNAVATIAVKNLDEAARFYEETLGLRRAGAEDDEVVVFESGDSMINVYRSSFAGTNQATALTWTVDDVEDSSAHSRPRGSDSSTTISRTPSAKATCTCRAISRSFGSRIRTATSSASTIAESQFGRYQRRAK